MIARRPEAAVYQQVAADLREQIADGRLRPGQRLPSEPHLGQTYGVARETVRRAVRLLVIEGLVTVQAGRGTWVSMPAAVVEQTIPRGGSTGPARPATPQERLAMGLAEGAWVMPMRDAGGRVKGWFDAATTKFRSK